MRRGKNYFVAVAMATVATIAAIAIGCGEKQAPTSTASTAAPNVAAAAAAPAQPTPPQGAIVPAGWRKLQLGMSEADAKRIIQEYRTSSSTKWEMSPTTHLLTVRLEERKIDSIAVDRKRFHEWSIRDLDEGAKAVHAWFDQGKLVAIRVEGTATPDSFIRKASEAYGAPPRNMPFTFFDDRTMMSESQGVGLWSGEDATALVWTYATKPILFLWSNASMGDYAARYKSALDAPAAAALEAARVKENGTKF